MIGFPAASTRLPLITPVRPGFPSLKMTTPLAPAACALRTFTPKLHEPRWMSAIRPGTKPLKSAEVHPLDELGLGVAGMMIPPGRLQQRVRRHPRALARVPVLAERVVVSRRRDLAERRCRRVRVVRERVLLDRHVVPEALHHGRDVVGRRLVARFARVARRVTVGRARVCVRDRLELLHVRPEVYLLDAREE